MNRNMHLPRREREALEAVYALGRASVHDVQAELPDHPSYSATRMLLQRLHKRGLLVATRDGARYLYAPSTSPAAAGRDAFERLLSVFFDGSPSKALSTLIEDEAIDAKELEELEALLAAAREKGKNH